MSVDGRTRAFGEQDVQHAEGHWRNSTNTQLTRLGFSTARMKGRMSVGKNDMRWTRRHDDDDVLGGRPTCLAPRASLHTFRPSCMHHAWKPNRTIDEEHKSDLIVHVSKLHRRKMRRLDMC